MVSFDTCPDAALIFCCGRSLPQDQEIEGEEVGVFPASSRG
jgi:fructose-specific component phosphotransferase system IIB-like protein